MATVAISEAQGISFPEPRKVHDLKTWPEFFCAVEEGRKGFEVRQDDRDFQVGDDLYLKEWCPQEKAYTGRWLIARVTYLLRGSQWGIAEGTVILSISPYFRSRVGG